MSLVFIEGFESWPTTLSQEIFNRRVALLDTFRTGWTVSATGGRRGGAALRNADSVYVCNFGISMPANTEYAIVGAAFYLEYTNNEVVFVFYSAAEVQVDVRILTDGTVRIRRRDGAILASSAPGIVSYNRWHYIEAKAKIHDSAGYVEVRVDGVNVVSFSGDTHYSGGNDYVTSVAVILPPQDTVATYLDDIYVCTGDGTYNNDFLGDCRVDYLPANANGTVNEFARSTGANNYENVDEVAGADDDTTYNYSGTDTDQDLYGCANLSFTPIEVLGVQIENMARQAGTGDTRSLKPLARSGGTTYDQAAQPLSESWACKMKPLDRDPNGSIAWTESAVNSLEVGLEVA